MLGVLLACLALGGAPARANREVRSRGLLQVQPEPPRPPQGQIEGACGLAVHSSTLYVADYYQRVVDAFSLAGEYLSQIVLPGGPITGEGANALDGVCGLASVAGPGGVLYGNEWHEGVLRLKPTAMVFDTGESTGVAVDEAGRVYADDRTYVAVYEPSGEAVEAGGEPLRIGAGSLGDGYGVAVAADGSRVYVPDAASGTVKVFEPAGDPAVPVAEAAPPGGFASLADAAAAVDPTNGHLVVIGNAEPGYEHPRATVFEFDASGGYLGALACSPGFGAPSGVAFDSSGNLYVTDGDSELANVYEYGPYTSGAVPPACGSSSAAAGAALLGGVEPPAPSVATSPTPGPVSNVVPARPNAGSTRPAPGRRKGGGATRVQQGSIRVALSGGLSPTRLPRTGAAPISVTVGGTISTTDPASPPQLRKVAFAFNRAGRLDTKGLPRCRRTDIDPSSTQQALRACGDALVGEGRFAAAVRLPEQSPFPSAGKVTAFNGVEHGKPVVFAHIYGTEPVPTSIVLPLRVRHAKGRFATLLEASLAGLTGEWGYVKSIDLRLGRRYRAGGRRHSFLSAGCPAPKGFPGAVFPLARASFSFDGGKTLSATLTRNCTVRR